MTFGIKKQKISKTSGIKAPKGAFIVQKKDQQKLVSFDKGC